jgi:hypothetical protein
LKTKKGEGESKQLALSDLLERLLLLLHAQQREQREEEKEVC